MAAEDTRAPARPAPSGVATRWAGGGQARLAMPAALGAAAAAGVLALALRDPHRPGAWGFCPVRLGLGVDCPGCGGLRAVHDLTQGDVLGALSSNVVVVALLPLVVALWAAWLVSRWRDRPLPGAARGQLVVGVAVAVLLVVFAVVRNLPGLEWLAS